QTAALLEQVRSYSLQRDAFGNPTRYSRTRTDGATATTAISYDPFGLLPIRTETTATGLAQPFVTRVDRDAQSLLPMTLFNSNGAGVFNTYDDFGRLTKVSLSLPGDPTRYILRETTFTGFDQSLMPRSVHNRLYSQYTPEANAATVDPKSVSTYTETLDEMGR